MTTGLKTFGVAYLSKSGNTYTSEVRSHSVKELANTIGSQIAEGNPAYAEVDSGQNDMGVIMTSEIESFFITKVEDEP